MDLEKIKEIIELMNEHELSEFSYEEHNKYKLCLKQGGNVQTVISAPGQAPAASSKPVPANEKIIESPLVGTFYGSASPEAPQYVSVGDEVTEDTVVCIVEAMKVMNEITAGFNGTITEVLVSNAEPLEYGQPLFKIKTK